MRDDVGYRVGIHMKGYIDKQPIIVVGGRAGDFFGEYMAGGYLVLLGATTDVSRPIVGDYVATGMHGGVMYIRGNVEEHKLGKEVIRLPWEGPDEEVLEPILASFLKEMSIELKIFDFDQYTKIVPKSARPYGKLYAY